MVQEAQARLKTDPALQAMVAGNPMLKRAAAMMDDPAAVERAQAQMMGLSPEKMQSAMSAMSAMQAPSTPAASPPPDSVSDGSDGKASEAGATSGGGFVWGSIKEVTLMPLSYVFVRVVRYVFLTPPHTPTESGLLSRFFEF
jgi:hypothetical protein